MQIIHQHLQSEKLLLPKKQNSMTLRELIRFARKTFELEDISSSALNAELIVCSELNITRTELYLNPEAIITADKILSIGEKINRRISGEPLQYILGYTEFYGLKIMVNDSVFIPRPETELLVDKALEIISIRNKKNTILEIGTGSGCIAIALAKNSKSKIHAIDISDKALKTASENSYINETQDKINFESTNLFDMDNISKFDLIISNPPYIPYEETKFLSNEVKAEPEIALTDFADGLNFYRKIFHLARNSENSHDILLEIGDGKKTLVESLAKDYQFNPLFYKDYSGTERIIHIRT